MKGLELSQNYYKQVVKPIIDTAFPGLNHTACLIGFGSDVIGYDDVISRDHMWGPRLIIFLRDQDIVTYKDQVNQVLSQQLPHEFLGFSTHFSDPDPNDGGVMHLEKKDKGPINHFIQIESMGAYIKTYINYDIKTEPSLEDWLTATEHRLLALTSGGVFHDDLGLEDIRKKLSYYPKDLRNYNLSSLWNIISEEIAFVGRTGAVDDDLGSRLITSRISELLMRICFAAEGIYAPYAKWFGTAFKRLAVYDVLGGRFMDLQKASTWQERESILCDLYEGICNFYQDKGWFPSLNIKRESYFGRPYQVVFLDGISDAFHDLIDDQELRGLRRLGTVNHMTTNTQIFDDPKINYRLMTLYK